MTLTGGLANYSEKIRGCYLLFQSFQRRGVALFATHILPHALNVLTPFFGRRLFADRTPAGIAAVVAELVSDEFVSTLDDISEDPVLLISTGVEKMHAHLRHHIQKVLG